MSTPNSYMTGPDERGLFGIFGGRFVAETLMPLILDLEREWGEAKPDPAFWEEFNMLAMVVVLCVETNVWVCDGVIGAQAV